MLIAQKVYSTDIISELFHNMEDYCMPETNVENKIKYDLSESDSKYGLHLIVPGFKKKNITVDINDKTLTIKGERKVDNKKSYIRKESMVGEFEKVFDVPDNVDYENINASMEDGILNIIIPKLNNDLKRKIEVK